MAFCAGGDVGKVAGIYYLSSVASGIRSDVDYIVGRAHYLLVVFHHYYGVAYLLQLAQDAYQPVCVAAVEANARFVENVQRAYETAAQ